MKGIFKTKKIIGCDNHLDIRTIGKDVQISSFFFPSVIRKLLIKL